MAQHGEEMVRYIAAITSTLMAMFAEDPDELMFELPHFDAERIDATLFATAVPYAVNIWLRQVMGMKLDNLEVTYTLNRLVYQYEKDLAVKEALEADE